MSNSFWVYINEPNNKAFIHLSSCSYCKDGKGIEQNTLDHNGKWVGPFEKEDAIVQAKNSGKKTIRWCGFCAKKLKINVELGN